MTLRRHPIAVSKRSETLSRLPLDARLVERLRGTYEALRAEDARLAEVFYAKLFAAAPHLRGMFKGEPEAQARKLMAALDAVVKNFEKPEANAAMIAELGKRHAGYGAKPEHYDLVIDLLVESMEELLGAKGWATRESLREWRMALRLISDQMIAGAGS
jgi:hemoglobin-like flavoprotein